MGRPKTDGGRIDWLDELRTFMIVLVVNMHACVTYSHVGSWYVNEAPEPSLMTKLPFVFWQAHLQSFFMGTLFLVSGYLAHGAIGRRGPAGFARERLFRLGLPTLLYMLVLHPLIVIAINPYGNDYGSKLRAYERFVLHGDFVGSSGPMWFAAALLVFCLVLAAVRGMRGADAAPDGSEPAGPSPRAVLLWLAGLIGATFLTRTVQPLNTSVLNMQLCYFPQYVFAFVTGLAAARGRWLERLAGSPLARRSGWCALVLGTPLLAGVLVFGGVLKGKGLTLLGGGWHLAALAYAAWEQTVGHGAWPGLPGALLHQVEPGHSLVQVAIQ